MMFDYGNTLGNAWILKTRLTYVREKLKKEMQEYTPGAAPKRGLFKKKPENGNSVAEWIRGEESDDIYKINKELEAYNPEIAARPQVIAANKIGAK